MRRALLSIAILAFAAGCQTTGNPTQGGLFGWSESKARDRLDQKYDDLARHEDRRDLERSKTKRLAKETSGNEATIASQRAQLARILANVDQLEADSPTSAGASRARRIRQEIYRVQSDETASLDERWERIRNLDRAVAQLNAELGLIPRHPEKLTR